MNEQLWQITAPHFVAGMVVRNNIVKEAAPILKWSIGKQWSWVRDYCIRKGWHGKKV